MSAASLLDRCVTGSATSAFSVIIDEVNQRLESRTLLDCCLTASGVQSNSHRDEDILSDVPRELRRNEIDVKRVFFQYQPPRPLAEIDAELAEVEKRILELLREVTQ